MVRWRSRRPRVVPSSPLAEKIIISGIEFTVVASFLSPPLRRPFSGPFAIQLRLPVAHRIQFQEFLQSLKICGFCALQSFSRKPHAVSLKRPSTVKTQAEKKMVLAGKATFSNYQINGQRVTGGKHAKEKFATRDICTSSAILLLVTLAIPCALRSCLRWYRGH